MSEGPFDGKPLQLSPVSLSFHVYVRLTVISVFLLCEYPQHLLLSFSPTPYPVGTYVQGKSLSPAHSVGPPA